MAPGTHARSTQHTPDDHVIVLFGATGDLAKRMLLPGLFHLAVAGLMPKRYRLIGSAPSVEHVHEDGFEAHVHDALQTFRPREMSDEMWKPFCENVGFSVASDDNMDDLVKAVKQAEEAIGGSSRRLLYLAVPPHAVTAMVERIGAVGLDERARVICEKPFGSDLKSAVALNATLHAVFEERDIFRIDHFLGKEAVQNILALRFANGLFEPIWNRAHLDYVQIDVPETLSIEGRAGFYEQTGCFLDMVVTHLLQLLGFVALEPPATFDADSLRDEKSKVFRSLAPLSPEHTVYGQYDGYRSEPGVASDSTIETFVALEARIENWRWQGVPFYLRTGKCLAQDRRAITLGFKEPPRRMFDLAEGVPSGARPNELVFDLADPPSITARFLAKEPGATMELGPASLTFRYADSFTAARELEAYERLIHDAMIGDATLFNRADGIEHIWRAAHPLLADPPIPQPYSQGSWGPKQAVRLPKQRGWYLPDEQR